MVQISIVGWNEPKIFLCYTLMKKDANHNSRQLQFKNGRKALSDAAHASGINMEHHTFEIFENEGGKIVDSNGTFRASASISHSKSHSFAVVGPRDYSIGLDVEPSNRIVGREVLKYIDSTLDSLQEHELSNDELITLWIQNEAIVKATGHGLSITKNVYRQNKQWVFGKNAFSTIHWKIDLEEYSFCIALAKKLER